MGLFDKLKNIFIEEDEVVEELPIKRVEPKIEEIKKEEIVEEKAPVINKVISDRELTDTNQKFKFPIIFEDDDFKEEKKEKKSINILERENTRYEPENKRDIRTQKKVFKPSPVISPVYGVLDKNYSKDDITSKDGLLNDSEDKIDIDTVIKKAFEREEEFTITREEKKKRSKVEESLDLPSEVDEPIIEESETISIELDEKSEDTSLEEMDDKIKSIDELLKDTSDDDFYSLVDNMYKDEEENDIE